MTDSIWTFGAGLIDSGDSVKGFEVDAVDGPVGTVAWASYAPGESYLVVTGRHHLRPTHHVIPARAVAGVDTEERKLRLAFTKREVEQSPEHHDPAFPVDLPSADSLAGLWPSWLHEPSG
jgi:hypothetical protein